MKKIPRSNLSIYRSLLLVCVWSASFTQFCHADVVLTFDQNGIIDFATLSQAYGDRVVATPDENNNQYNIVPGMGFGLTPNVLAEYSGGIMAGPRLWTIGYGDLTNIYYNETDFDSLLRITLTADPGFEVGVFGFQMAAFGTNPPVPGIDIRDCDGNVLWAVGSTVISGTSHNDFEFADGLFSNQLTINVDLSGLGGNSDNIGIDNIHIVQRSVLLGDVNRDGIITLLDVAPFVNVLTNGGCQAEADINLDGVVNLLDVEPFVDLLTGG